MTRRTEAVDWISFLSRAESRVCLMECLLEAEPLDQRALKRRLDHSRSTITRSLDSLVEAGWVTEQPAGYQLTPVGRLVGSEFRELLSTVETAETLAPFLEWFPLSSYDISLEALRDGEVTAVSEGDPLAPARKQTELLQSTSQFRGLFSAMDIEGMRLVHDRTMAGEFEAEIVVSPDVAEMLHDEPFAPLVSELLASGRHTVHVAEEIPFYLGIADETTVQIGVEDDEGMPRALLESTNESVRRWADSLCSRYRQSATEKLTQQSFD